MDKADLPKPPVEISLPEPDDIPVAWRESSAVKEQFSSLLVVWIKRGLLGLGGIILVSLLFVFSTGLLSRQESLSNNSEEVNPPTPAPTPPDNLLGHLSYEEAPESELKPIIHDGSMRLRTEAAKKFLEMQAAARASRIILQPISAFRTVSEQQRLFFEVKEQRGQVATKRAEVSAPPGYSEHHTGYAIDLGDAKTPATNLSPSFAKTAAFRWLEKNAAYYSFELSFPQDNLQGVSYEPWHWRFVGDRHSLETFYKARNLQQPIENNQ